MVGTTDLGTFGKYVIDGETGKIEHHQLFHDSRIHLVFASLYKQRALL
jgi:hypothetical protein